jgi:hypothetical protein
MAKTITPEFIEAFKRADEATGRQFYDGLKDDEKAALATALKSGEPNMSVAAPSGLDRFHPSTMASPVVPPEQTMEEIQDSSNLSRLNTVTRPAREAIGAGMDFLRKGVSDAVLGVAGFDPADPLTGGLPGLEVEKKVVEVGAGMVPDIALGMAVPSTGVGRVVGAAIPRFAALATKAPRTAAFLDDFLPKAANVITEGVVQGGAQNYLEAKSVGEGAAGGAAFASIFAGVMAGKALRSAVGAPRTVHPAEADILARELVTSDEAVPATTKPPAQLVPVFSTVFQSPEGAWTGRVKYADAGSGATVDFDYPLQSGEDVARFKAVDKGLFQISKEYAGRFSQEHPDWNDTLRVNLDPPRDGPPTTDTPPGQAPVIVRFRGGKVDVTPLQRAPRPGEMVEIGHKVSVADTNGVWEGFVVRKTDDGVVVKGWDGKEKAVKSYQIVPAKTNNNVFDGWDDFDSEFKAAQNEVNTALGRRMDTLVVHETAVSDPNMTRGGERRGVSALAADKLAGRKPANTNALPPKLRTQDASSTLDPTRVTPKDGGGGRGGPPTPAPQGAAGPPANFASGNRVFYGARRGHDADLGTVVGPDPRKPGNWLVKTSPGALPGAELSFAERELFHADPPGMAKNLPLSIPLLEGAPPASVGLVPEQITAVNNMKQLMTRLNAQAGGSKVVSELLNGRFRGPLDMQRAIREVQSAQHFESLRNETYQALRSQFPNEQLFADFDRDLAKLARGWKRDPGSALAVRKPSQAVVEGSTKLAKTSEAPPQSKRFSFEEMESKWGEKFRPVRSYVERMLREIDELDARIAKLGGIPESAIIFRELGLIDTYLARSYLAYILPKGEWAKRMPADIFDEAVNFLMQQKALNDKGWTEATLLAELREIVNAEDPLAAFLKHPQLGKSYKNLRTREALPGPIRKMLGEVDSGMVQVATTLANQRAILANLESWDYIVNHVDLNGVNDWFSPGFREDLHSTPLPDNAKLFGRAAGGYVKKEIFEAMAPQGESRNNVLAAIRAITGIFKGNLVSPTVAGLRSLYNSTVGGIYSGMISGGLELYKPHKAGQQMVQAFKAMRDFEKDPTGFTGQGALMLEMRRLGADWAGNTATEIGSTDATFMRELDKILPKLGPAATLWDVLTAYTKTAGRAYKAWQGKGAYVLDFGDRLFRTQAYIGLRQEYLDEFLKMGYNPQDAINSAAKKAADDVNRSFFNAVHTAPIVDKARKYGGGIVAPFLTSIYEDHRINFMLPRRMAQDPKLMFKMLGNLSTLGAVYAGSMYLGGYRTAADVEQIREDAANYTRRQRYYRPVILPMPWRDANGKTQFLDLTQAWLPFRLMAGHPDEPLFKRLMTNLFTGPFEGSPSGDAIDKHMETAGLARPMAPYQPMEGEAGVAAALDSLSRAGVLPRGYSAATTILRESGATDAFGKPGRTSTGMTPGQAVGNALGAPLMPASNPDARSLETNIMRGDLRKQVRSNARSNRTDDQKAKVQQSIDERFNKLNKK